MDILVREATLEDAALIAELTRAAWAARAPVIVDRHGETADHVTAHLQQGGGYILLADGLPAGSTRWLPLESACGIWEILRIGIIPEYRGHALSQHLLEAVVHRAMEADIAELRLAVNSEETRLLALYAAYGFQPAPELEYSHANPQAPQPLVMRRLLRP